MITADIFFALLLRNSIDLWLCICNLQGFRKFDTWTKCLDNQSSFIFMAHGRVITTKAHDENIAFPENRKLGLVTMTKLDFQIKICLIIRWHFLLVQKLITCFFQSCVLEQQVYCICRFHVNSRPSCLHCNTYQLATIWENIEHFGDDW